MTVKIKKRIKISFLLLIFFFVTLLVGFIVAEKNTKRICFGDNSPCFSFEVDEGKSCYLNIDILGFNKRINLSDNYVKIYCFFKKNNTSSLIFLKGFDVRSHL